MSYIKWGTAAPSGRILVIGGAESHCEHDDTILDRFVEISGRGSARIIVIATASGDPDKIEAEYIEVFTRLGAGHVEALRLEHREQANSDHAVALLRSATGVFFTGGDQLRITTVLGGSRVDTILHERAEDGLVLAGTSAGATMMASTMIVEGQGSRVSPGSVRTGPGLEFVHGVLIDMHFAERGRLNRLLSAIAQYPHELGLGIDENTAILVEGSRFEVIGAGSVTVIDAGPASTIETPSEELGPIALCGVRLHVLPHGYTFELNGRQPRITEAPEPEEQP
ncbi:cyanophycinase [Phytomonospora endophytica]|uniref:Cyanophycinase n=1 Tax=Phytomonospora endophytica TaxID=714109 RepID=A0A841FCI7_9ACTN|nr:cyanophycinase [Phytomonospora endophytica]MBB6033976.1 cyanophycinase [Phytomonospora endophytica]GIG64503.1 cyanophycinase [Phytomonospora endophytica]